MRLSALIEELEQIAEGLDGDVEVILHVPNARKDLFIHHIDDPDDESVTIWLTEDAGI